MVPMMIAQYGHLMERVSTFAQIEEEFGIFGGSSSVYPNPSKK